MRVRKYCRWMALISNINYKILPKVYVLNLVVVKIHWSLIFSGIIIFQNREKFVAYRCWFYFHCTLDCIAWMLLEGCSKESYRLCYIWIYFYAGYASFSAYIYVWLVALLLFPYFLSIDWWYYTAPFLTSVRPWPPDGMRGPSSTTKLPDKQKKCRRLFLGLFFRLKNSWCPVTWGSVWRGPCD